MEMIRGLVYVTDADKGIYRKRAGKGFYYVDSNKQKVKDEKVLSRIAGLKIPPMWADVWICTKPNGHLQATGKDQRNRKQYLYHEKWAQYRNTSKFKRMPEFARALPLIRAASLKDMNQRGWAKDKVLGLVVQFLNEAFIRIGNIYYKEQNETYGLTTLRRKHLHIEDNQLSFQYKAKSGKYRKIGIKNRKICKLVKECSELPGHEIFRYYDEGNKCWTCIDSHDVNEYLRKITGEQFSSKDFRTWGGTVLAIEKYEEAKTEIGENTRKSLVPTLIKKVAAALGNTVAICRAYYIHPAILAVVESDGLDAYKKGINKKYIKLKDALSADELVALNIIETFENNTSQKGKVIAVPKEAAA